MKILKRNWRGIYRQFQLQNSGKMLKMIKETSSQAAVEITILRSKNKGRYYKGTKRNLDTVLTTNEKSGGGGLRC